ncbi:RNA polymerase sigma factor [Sutcliffiella rhizosphaerae]|uniref:RNA polymerase sigma factor n=1 Tax=Sutcliffiella rhizosphaerae TaxID=2880967 RepID=A0ABN8AEL9_9BACI|nr:RNA polymerase sigma factor [Sutcliffiella rhizosphaerae]CAG9622562.1 RNA polymerase sigma-H factor [Sutcliffiella rhizosphaerae]
MDSGVEEMEVETRLCEMEDQKLVQIAQTGDRDAFGELVKRYRRKAMTWAQFMAKDTELAEDIVQEAFIKAFIHMGSLIDVSRFTPWLRRIVNNQANMKLRRGGPNKNEQLFTCMENNYAAKWDSIDFHDIDHILYHLTKRVTNDIHLEYGNPETLILKKEVIDGIHALLHCLTKRERQVFEAHFFQQISPSEMGTLFGMSVGNIYTTLSRTKVKIKRERTRIDLSNYLKVQLGSEASKRKVLSKPINL